MRKGLVVLGIGVAFGLCCGVGFDFAAVQHGGARVLAESELYAAAAFFTLLGCGLMYLAVCSWMLVLDYSLRAFGVHAALMELLVARTSRKRWWRRAANWCKRAEEWRNGWERD